MLGPVVDVFIVGGGPAGLAAAIALRRHGFAVTVVDSQRPSIDKACGEGIMPEGVAAALQLGIDLGAIPSARVRGIRLLGDDASVCGDFPEGCGFGVRRTALHAAMIAKAEQSGVEIRWGQPIGDLKQIQARWIIGADGAASRVRQWAGLDRFATNTWRFGFTCHYRLAPWTDYIEGHYSDGLQLFVTPLASDEIGIALLSRNPKIRIREALAQLPGLQRRIGSATAVSPERGASTASRRLKRVTRGNVALTGDASGSVDAITAAGLSLNFGQAIAVADAIREGDLSAYEKAHRRLLRRPRLMAGLMLTMDRSPVIRRCALRSMAACPEIFRGLLAVHAGAVNWRSGAGVVGEAKC